MSEPTPQPTPQDTPPNPARKWIIATVVLLIAVVGAGAWALSLRSDVDDKDAQIAAQEDAASGVAENAQQALGELGDQLGEAQSDAAADAAATQQKTEDEIASAEKAATDAEARAENAEDEATEANARADEAAAEADAVGACARGYLSAIRSVFDAPSISEGVDQAKSDIETLNSSCREKLSS